VDVEMTNSESPPPSSDDFWYEFLTRGDAAERRVRNVFRRLPSSARCGLCAAPFAGPAARLMRAIGKRRSDYNPVVCTSCFDFMKEHRGGAEIDCTMLFADIRGSTAMAETMSPKEFRDRLDRFYRTATEAVFAHEGGIDKFVGDELVAIFYPLLSGPEHVARAVDTARDLLVRTGHADAAGPWVPVGAAVHTGRTWVGAVGDGSHVELTALGDPVNTTARLAAAARAGEILVTVEAAAAAGLDPSLPRATFELKGKQLPTEVVSVRIGTGSAAPT
jgi:adenylate cyclase